MSLIYNGCLNPFSNPPYRNFSSDDSLATILEAGYFNDYLSFLTNSDNLFISFPGGTLLGSCLVDGETVTFYLNHICSNSSHASTPILYNGTSYISSTIVWTGSSTTSSGIATFYPTDDGTGSGNALFTNIFSVSALAENDTTSAIAYPFSSLKLIAANKKTITVNVGIGQAIVTSGDSIANAPNGTNVYLTVIGN